MPEQSNPRPLFHSLLQRRRELPDILRELWGVPHPVESAVDLCDDLLADLDALLSRTVTGLEQSQPWEELADDILGLKTQVYEALIRFCAARGSDELAQVLRRSMLRDLADSADRIRMGLALGSNPFRVAC